MELTLESALSPGGMVGNASYLLLIASMAMRDILWLRCLAIASGVTGIAYDAIWLSDPVGVFWESCFTLTNVIQWWLLVREQRKLRLTATERGLWHNYFSNLSQAECKRLLLASRTVSGKAGDVLIANGQIVDHLYMLVEGEVSIFVDGVNVSQCGPGDLLGEMSFLTGEPAAAETRFVSDAQLIRIEQDSLATLVQSSTELGRSLSSLISQNLVDKLSRQNLIDAARLAGSAATGPSASAITSAPAPSPAT